MATHGLIVWLIIGGVAGWLAGLIVRGGGYGIIGDIVVGIIGGVLFGWLFGASGMMVGSGLIGSIISATIGAVILIVVLRLVSRVV
ncbi:MAG TPA: GlsB/YeaQ/YmgE family stress response membrane protein [Roseiarcus sp.]|nr:GlsB/YeaQ/YmgE family stress response membrane protein [Roseiarcus sp.]